MGHKSIIKVSNKFFTDDELNLLAVVCPDVSLAVIRDFEVVEKKTVTLPEEMVGIIKCPNPVCITNNEPMRTRFSINKEKGTCRCRYCNKEQSLDNVKLK
jgi:aspartate carbamoyltransferase regulatory subunit